MIRKIIPGYDGRYAVGSDGSIHRLDSVHIPTKNKKGYMVVHLSFEGVRKTKYIHRLVAEAFIGPNPGGLQVNHKDGDKANNNVENLEWVSSRENNIHALETGLRTLPENFQSIGGVAAAAKRRAKREALAPPHRTDGEVSSPSDALRLLISRLETWPISFTSGVCMCGAEIQGHPYDNHSPTDSGEYNVAEAIKEAKQAVATPPHQAGDVSSQTEG